VHNILLSGCATRPVQNSTGRTTAFSTKPHVFTGFHEFFYHLLKFNFLHFFLISKKTEGILQRHRYRQPVKAWKN